MNWLDVVLLVIFGASVAMSFRKGLSREVIGLASVVLAIVLGIWFYGTAGSFLVPYLSSRAAANFAGFVLVFCGVMLAGSLVSYTVGKFLKVTGLSIFDHLLGAVFGAVRGILISVALILAIMAFSQGDKPPSSVVNSRTAPYVVDAARAFAAMAPHELKEGFRRTYGQVKTAWEKTLGQGIGSVPNAEKGKE
ncbi:MAG: CvpA family protein [Bryobacteraceae bacterium]|jgi:membrane protein required for colicin V production